MGIGVPSWSRYNPLTFQANVTTMPLYDHISGLASYLIQIIEHTEYEDIQNQIWSKFEHLYRERREKNT